MFLNLIDTPHVLILVMKFPELKAVEGAVLLVDATQGVQARTIVNVETARALGLKVIPVINKIDLPIARVEETKKEIVEIIGCEESEILVPRCRARPAKALAIFLERGDRARSSAEIRGIR